MDTKEKILFNALEMFSQTGYNTVSIRDIAEAMDIKESSIYYHFKNKQDVFFCNDNADISLYVERRFD